MGASADQQPARAGAVHLVVDREWKGKMAKNGNATCSA